MLDKLQERVPHRARSAGRQPHVVRVGITAAGLDLLGDLHEPLQQCHARQLGHLSQHRLKMLIALLKEAREPHEDDAAGWK